MSFSSTTDMHPLADDVSEPRSPEVSPSRTSPTRQNAHHFLEQRLSSDGDAEHLAHLLPRKEDVISNGRYAKVHVLGKYIPEVIPNDPRARTFRAKIAKRTTMLKFQTGIALSVMALNIGTTIWAVIVYPPNHQGIGSITFGSCHNLSLINTLLHGLINILSSLLLGAGSYCMQLLVGPSRREIDKAHANGRSLEIGVASIKNLRHIAGKRSTIWAFLGISSTLLHFFWNSTVFTSTPVVSVPRAIATSDFQTSSDNWTITDPLLQRSWWKLPGLWGNVSYDLAPLYAMQTTASNMNRSEPRECLERFTNPWTSTQSLLIIAQNSSSQEYNGSSLIDGWMSGWDMWPASHGWICAAYPGADSRSCTQEWASTFADEWIVPGVPSGGASSERQNVTVDYCLVGDTVDIEDRCGLHFSAKIMGIVCICTMLEAFLICLTWFNHSRAKKADTTGQSQRTMVTVGDAISDFLERPDAFTNEHDEVENVSETRRRASYALRVGRWRDDHVSWFKVVSNRTWVVSISLFAFGVAMPTYSLISSVNWLKKMKIPVSSSSIWRQGFKPSWETVVFNSWNSQSRNFSDFMANILIANSFQVGLSFLYLIYNNILTRQLLADEWVRFIQPDGKKSLRVSSPVGLQRSSYFLSLPFKYSVPLMACSIMLHWLISQSIFLVQTSAFDPGPDGGHNPAFDVSARGYSILGTIFSISTGLILILALLINAGVRKYQGIPSGFQRMATDSAAISLMCLRPEADAEAYLFPLRIGAISDGRTVSKELQGRIAFSTDIEMSEPEEDSQYLMPQSVREGEGTRMLLGSVP